MIIKKSDLVLVKELQPATQPFNFDGETDASAMANLMTARMKEIGVIGLSANQVGVNARMFVMGIDDLHFEIFNPKVNSVSEDEEAVVEGTIMYPGVHVIVRRPKSINVTFTNKLGEEITTDLTGLTSRIFLHEMDSLDGVTLKDKVSKLKWDLATKRNKNKKEKIIKKHVKQQLINIQKEIDANT